MCRLLLHEAYTLLMCMPSHFSYVWLFATLWTIACQAPLSMQSSRQEYWSGLPFPSPGSLPNPGIKPVSPASPDIGRWFFTAEPPGTPRAIILQKELLWKRKSTCNVSKPQFFLFVLFCLSSRTSCDTKTFMKCLYWSDKHEKQTCGHTWFHVFLSPHMIPSGLCRAVWKLWY